MVDAETSSGTYTPFASSQTAVPGLGPPFPFDSCKGARPDGTNVNHALVKRAGAGGIGSMRHSTRNWISLSRKHETQRKDYGSIRLRFRRGSIAVAEKGPAIRDDELFAFMLRWLKKLSARVGASLAPNS